MDLLSAWVVLGGAADKAGVVKINLIKDLIKKYEFIIDFDIWDTYFDYTRYWVNGFFIRRFKFSSKIVGPTMCSCTCCN